MITIEDRSGKEHKMKSTIKELTLQEYDKLTSVMAREGQTNMERIIGLCTVCGLSKEVAENTGYKALIKIYNAMGFNDPISEPDSKIVIGNYTFIVPSYIDGELDLTGGEMMEVEKILQGDQRDKTAKIMNLLMILDLENSKRELDSVERLNLIKDEMTPEQAIPYTSRIFADIVETFNPSK